MPAAVRSSAARQDSEGMTAESHVKTDSTMTDGASARGGDMFSTMLMCVISRFNATPAFVVDETGSYLSCVVAAYTASM
jgi:hypothetical protein